MSAIFKLKSFSYNTYTMTMQQDEGEWSIEKDLEFMYGSSCSGHFYGGFDGAMDDVYFLIGGYTNCTDTEEIFNDIR